MKKIGLVVAFLFIAYMMFMGDGVNDSVVDEYETTQEANSGKEKVEKVEDKVSGENDTTTSASKANNTATISGDELKVHFIDVGQGDSILVESPNNHFMLIDGGVKGSGEKVVNYLNEQGVGELDYVVATHPDADHIGGLISVLNAFKVNEFIDSGKVHTSQTFEQMISLVDQKNIPYTVPKVGDTVQLDDELVISVISADEHATDNNEASIVLKITHGEISYLLAADAGVEMEKLMLRNENIKATVLKAGHHGSNTSSSQAFLKAVQPEVTILSYGQDNSYGHPHAEVVTGLQQVGSKIYGTAEAGTIIVSSNGTSYEVNAAEWTGVGATSSIKPAVKVEVTKPSTNGNIVISSKDLEGEIIGITNDASEKISLQGWSLLSVEGNQVFNFPNISLAAGDTIYITSGSDAKEGQGYLKWSGRQIWLNDGDAAKLMNAKGEVVSELQ